MWLLCVIPSDAKTLHSPGQRRTSASESRNVPVSYIFMGLRGLYCIHKNKVFEDLLKNFIKKVLQIVWNIDPQMATCRPYSMSHMVALQHTLDLGSYAIPDCRAHSLHMLGSSTTQRPIWPRNCTGCFWTQGRCLGQELGIFTHRW